MCPRCVLAGILGEALQDPGSRQLLARLTQDKTSLGCGETLRRDGEDFQALYMLRAGALKTSTVSEDGSPQVIDFHFPGELIGLSALGTGRYLGLITALSPSALCVIRSTDLEDLSTRYPDVRKRLLQLAAREVGRRERMHQLMLGTRAEVRLALALLNIAGRLQVHSADGLSRFRLPMARADLAAYLGLTPETASRHLRNWESKGWISTRGREFRVEVPDALQVIASRGIPDGVSVNRTPLAGIGSGLPG